MDEADLIRICTVRPGERGLERGQKSLEEQMQFLPRYLVPRGGA